MKTLVSALLAAVVLAGCVAVPVYEPAPRVYRERGYDHPRHRHHDDHRYRR